MLSRKVFGQLGSVIVVIPATIVRVFSSSGIFNGMYGLGISVFLCPSSAFGGDPCIVLIQLHLCFCMWIHSKFLRYMKLDFKSAVAVDIKTKSIFVIPIFLLADNPWSHVLRPK